MKKLIFILSLFLGVHAFAQGAMTVNVGDSFTMTVTADGTKPFSYKWFKNGVVIAGATSATYVITSAALTDSASYTAQVINSAGSYTTNTPAVISVTQVIPPSNSIITITVTPKVP